jgi:hypothetical protein
MMQGAQQIDDVSDNEFDDSRYSEDDNGSQETDNRHDLESERQERHNNNLIDGYVRIEELDAVQQRLAEFEEI